jgi:outer membrane protein
MKKLLGLVLALFTMVMLQGPAFPAQETKVGVVDLQTLQEKSKAFQNVKAEIQKKIQAMQQKLDQEKDALMKLEEDLQKQSMMLSLDAQEDKRRELEKKRRYYKYLQDDFSQELKAVELETINRIMKELQAIVKEIGDKEGYILILEKRTLGLVYYNEAIDITDRVIKAYDNAKK